MKKFLSLVLALIMTMSLVTISASAAEYKDFTDKDEIQYAEAVAVLNRLGIITGYSEGDFRPEGELTRGAAAKIIASLLIGPEAANNLTPTSAPFKDVPLDHTFAGPIAYCSTLEIINGYSDGSFQPGGTLTGYAFSKMLLGALGYDGNIEGFTGAGWNMNVMRLGGEAGLFDSISFKGNDPVNREEAAQLALNTLKGTMVEYSGGLNITAGNATINSDPTRAYKTSNQEFATHIRNRKVNNATEDNWYTVEFGEEHFVDLRMTHDRTTVDDFGRPSNEWSYKKVTIGTFPIEADYVYTEQMAHNVSTVSNATKARALGLTGFEVVSSDTGRTTAVTVNGKEEGTAMKDVGEIANYTDNGTVVEVYISEDDADWVQSVVVVKTQLMEVKRVAKEYVALDIYDGKSDANGDVLTGYNQEPIDVTVDNVEVDDAYYTLLSGLKVGDKVAVVPVTTGGNYTVAKAYVPETVSGKLTKVDTYGTGRNDVEAIGVTVGGNAYDIALWNKKLHDIDGDKIDVTTKDVTLTLDEFGNALLAQDVGETSDFMIIGNYYQSLVDGKLVTYIHGWDISGQELNLNIGTSSPEYFKSASATDSDNGFKPGDLVFYTNKGAAGSADWKISEMNTNGVFNVLNDGDYEIKASNTHISLASDIPGDTTGYRNNPYINKNIKFIYVTFDEDSGDVDYIEIKSGVQAASKTEIAKNLNGGNAAQAALDVSEGSVKINDKASVKAVVIKNESNDATAANMLYIRDYRGSATQRSDDGEIVYGYTVAMNGPDGIVDDEMVIYSTKKLDIGDWARYTKAEDDNFENFYTLKLVNQQKRATSTMDATVVDFVGNNHSLLTLNKFYTAGTNTEIPGSDVNITTKIDNLGLGDTDASKIVNVRNAEWVDLTGNSIRDYDDLWDLTKEARTKKFNISDIRLSMIFNDDTSKDGFRSVAMVVVQKVDASNSGSSSGVSGDVATITDTFVHNNGNLILTLNVKAPEFAATGATTDIPYTINVDGRYFSNGTISGVKNGTQTISIPSSTTGLSKDDNFEIVLDDENLAWSSVKVTYEGATPAAGSVTTVAKGATALTFGLATSDYTAANVKIEEGDVVLKANAAYAPAAAAAVNFDASKTVSGTAGVTVTFSGLTAAAKTFSVTDFDAVALNTLTEDDLDATDGTKTLTISFDPNGAAVAENSVVAVSAALSADPDNVYGYEVTVKVAGKTFTEVLNSDDDTYLGNITVTGNVAVTAGDITVKEIVKPAVVEDESGKVAVGISGVEYRIPFNAPIKLLDATVVTTTITGGTVSNVTVDGSTLVVTITGGTLSDTNTIVVGANAVAYDGIDGNKNTATTLTYGATASDWTAS